MSREKRNRRRAATYLLSVLAVCWLAGAHAGGSEEEPVTRERRAAEEAGRSSRRGARRKKPRREALAAWDAKLTARLREELAAGGRVRFSVTAFQQRFEVLSTDEADGMNVLRLGSPVTEVDMAWRRLEITDRLNLARALLREGDEAGHCLVAFYTIASGDEKGAREHMDRGGEGAAGVEASFVIAGGETVAGGASAAEGAKEKPSAPFDGARWTHVSETSAVIYWRLPNIQDSALSYVMYGETTGYGKKTEQTGEARWAQFHRITGLQTGRTYHYRTVNVDPAAKKETKSEDLTFTTRPAEGAVRVPDALQGPPYVLDRANTSYILTRDVRAAGTAIEIRASGVTLDLDGHTVVFGDNCKDQASGVLVSAKGPVTVCNGHIVDGDRCGDYSAGVQTRWRPYPLTVFGVSTDVHNKCVYPMKIFGRSKGFACHHNHLYSRVTEIESRHYPGNDLLRVDGIEGDVEVHDNILTEGCHIGMRIGGSKEAGPGKVEIHHNDIRHHQQYVNGYAFAAGCPGADIHHNRVTSTGRCVHLTADGIRFHDNWCDTTGHMTLSDMPQGSRPWKHQRVELHGIKFEGKGSRNCKVYGNFMRITQLLPVDSGGKGAPEDKVTNGVYVSSVATALSEGRLIDTTQRWEPDRWKGYWVKYTPGHPPAEIAGNDATSLRGRFAGGTAGPYSIYMKWDYVPATPLNIACYDPNAMNEVYENEIVAVTHYGRTRHGGYGDSGQWASSIYFVGMNRGRAREGEYSIYVHDNVFKSNHLFMSGTAANMDIRIERNSFLLLSDPPPASGHAVFRGVARDIMDAVKAGGNRFEGMAP